ncbi:NEDD8 ultimate buster 1 isoform X3 [Synchiropus splendidus]|nr:NEDD8 ultimate buster 1 isoform X3 [Synchiropus splendidus]XP_053715099.1 NEDD8 ultimate buster 1 isoform X3 [Synchiropus splendidus]XP_053715101.1 NEDD8 ultimate buster 1 isoform X3 [Synchiropus splendidus]
MQRNTEAKVKKLLKQQKVQLWNPPYTRNQQPSPEDVQELAQVFAPLLDLPAPELAEVLERIRAQSVHRGRGNKMFRETSVATLELLLPRDAQQVACSPVAACSKDQRRKTFLETRLDVPVQVLMDRMAEEWGLKKVKLILSGRSLCAAPGAAGREEPQPHHGAEAERGPGAAAAGGGAERAAVPEGLPDPVGARWEPGAGEQPLPAGGRSEGQRAEDPRVGEEGGVPSPQRVVCFCPATLLSVCVSACVCVRAQALTLAMSLHEKGRSLMKRRQYEHALAHLLQADAHFSACRSQLLLSVDNSGLLQLDIVWCYRGLEALSCLEDARGRLQRAEESFRRSYGAEQQRLQRIKGNTGGEEVLFVRLHLLQCLLCYVQGEDGAARSHLRTAESLYLRVCVDPEKLCQLMSLGFTEREARLGLRACQGEVAEAAAHITRRREEKEELKRKERLNKTIRSRMTASLMELGFSSRDVSRALDQSEGDADRAYQILSSPSVSPGSLEQLLYLGFDSSAAEAALRLAAGDLQAATQLLLDEQAVVSSGSSTEESSPSSSTSEEAALVSQVLEDICHHEDEHLDETLEEERELMTSLRKHLGGE